MLQLSSASALLTLRVYYCSRSQIQFDDIYGEFRRICLFSLCLTADWIRERPDTIRCIVANLVGDDDSGDSLVDENEPIQPLQNSEIEDYTDPNWQPEPIDAGPGKHITQFILIGTFNNFTKEFRTNKPSDVISTLVSIYDSKDLFVKELQVLLAQRLLTIKDGNFEKEVSFFNKNFRTRC